MKTFIPLFILSLTFFSCVSHSGADIIFYNGQILSMDRFLPPAGAMAIVDGKVLAVGHYEEIKPLANWRTKKINLKGATVIPGLTDGHEHLLGFSQSLENLNLFGTESPAQIAEMVKELAAKLPTGTWITGRGWDQNDWEDRRYPDRALLDAAAPDHPVALSRVDGHARWANSLALSLSGITDQSTDPEGGKYVRRANGELLGVLIDNAKVSLDNTIPSPNKADIRRLLENGIARLNQVGITAVHDAGVDQVTLDVLKEMADEGVLSLRYYGMLHGSEPELLAAHFAKGPTIDYADRITVRTVKIYADGALGSRGALLISPYTDDPGNRGLPVTSASEMEAVVKASIEAGFQPAIHAIGDAAVRRALNIYDKLIPDSEGEEHLVRPRIEHAQIIAKRDIKRFGKLGVIPSMQPTHATSDMYWAEERVGPTRIKGAYAWKALQESDAIIVSGSDSPVEKEEPLLQLYAARTRKDTTGWPEDGWYKWQRLSGLASARSMTTWAAFAAFQDSVRGKLLPGFDADLTILSHNPVGGEPEDILITKVLSTYIDGEEVWHNSGAWGEMPIPIGDRSKTDGVATN